MQTLRRIRFALGALALVVVAGTAGYLALGYGALDALYQSVAVITTVGVATTRPVSPAEKMFTIGLILAGVGTALYTFGVLLEALVEGHLRATLRRRRMDREIAGMRGHVIICGWGRVGRAAATYLARSGSRVVVVDRNAERLSDSPHPTVHGDVSEDDTLRRAGVAGASALVAALDSDAENLYVTLSCRSLQPEIVIIARARTESSVDKLIRAGASRVVNPQRIGGYRMGGFALQPHAVEFLDLIMHDGPLEFRLEEVVVAADSALAGKELAVALAGEVPGALLLALRHRDGRFTANPPASTVLEPGGVLIAVGTESQLDELRAAAGGSDGLSGPRRA